MIEVLIGVVVYLVVMIPLASFIGRFCALAHDPEVE